MRRLLAIVLIVAASTVTSLGAPEAHASTSRTFTLDTPTVAARSRAVGITLRLPAGVAAVDGRVFMQTGSAELLGVAPRGGGTALRPVQIRGGAGFGAYGLASTGSETLVDLVLVPHRTGHIQVRVVVDSLADLHGRRLGVSGGDRIGTLEVGRDRRVLGAPVPSQRPLPLRPTRALRELQPDGRFDRRDVEVARADWEQARLRGTPCGTAASSSTDANGDGCVDVIDLQATFAAKGTRTLIAGPDKEAAGATPNASFGILATTFVVTDSGDTPDATPGNGVCADANGVCTLRAAMMEANWTSGEDRIHFNLPGPAPARIQLVSGGPRLPLINSGSGGVIIDGYSQPGSRENDSIVGSNAIPGVEIRGNGPSLRETPFFITSSGNTIRGLLIQNTWRAIFLDGPNSSANRIIGNWIGFTASGANQTTSNGHGVSFTNGAHDNVVGTPLRADRNVIGNHNHAIDQYGAGTDGQIFQNNVLCIAPNGMTPAGCGVGIDHNFGPKRALIGGSEPNTRNVIGRTNLNGIEFSHGWIPNDPAKTSSLQWQINDHRVIGNWIGFRGDGSYHIDFRSGVGNQGTADNGNGVNVYDGSNDNLVEGNHIASRWDGVQVMMSNALRNTVRGNIIGESPLGQATAMAGWGIKIRIATRFNQLVGNTIKNAALGGIGLIQNNVNNIRISRNLVMDTNGHAIDLYGVPGPDPNDPGDTDSGANTLLNTPVLTKATTAVVSGTALPGATVEVYRASRLAGQFGLPVAFLGDVVVASTGFWSLPVSLTIGDRVTALQIRTNNDTSELAANMLVELGAPPQPGTTDVAADTFGRTVTAGWGSADTGGSYSTVGPAASYAVNGSIGTMRLDTGGTNRSAILGGGSALDVDLRARVGLDRLSVGGSLWIYGVVRYSGTTSVNGYQPKLRIAPNGAVYAHAGRVVSNRESAVAPEVLVPGLLAQPGGFLWLRTQVTGSNPTAVRVKVWADGQTEPSEWHFTATDSTPELQRAGAVGLRAYAASAVSNGPIGILYDDFSVNDPAL